MVWRYVPTKTSTVANGVFHKDVPVKNVVIHAPGSQPTVREGWIPIEIRTSFGSRWQGFKNACVDSMGRVAVDTRGREADEVVAKWKEAKNPCGGGLAGVCRGKRRRR